MVKFIAPYKQHEVGSVATLPAEQEAWLIARQYAVHHAETLPPLQDAPPARKLTTRKKK